MPVSEPLLRQLEAVLREAGEVALSYFGATPKQWTKHDQSPVSEADIAVDRLLRQRLSALIPSAAWLSEETEDDLARIGAAQVWIADPIDGTRAFLRGARDWGVSVALVENQRPVLAGLFVPADDEMFLAAAGAGATRNGVSIVVNDGTGAAGARIAGPRSELERLIQREPQAVAVPKIHSLALRIARVAEGALDVAVASGRAADWDLAAADLLVHEARGTLATLQGHVPKYNEAKVTHGPLFAAGRLRHRSLLELMGSGHSV